MWSFLYSLASPKWFYENTTWLQRPLLVCAIALLLSGLFTGLFIAPADYQQGDAFRIMYVHVPAAMLSMSLYALMGFLAILTLVWRIKLAGILLSSTAPIGASMALIALVTGSIWGKPMWGTWWIWDARLTSELILLLIYLAIIATQSSTRNPTQADKLVAVLTLVGLVDLPIIHFSVYWWNTLHQGATLSLFSKPKIASSMLYPLFLMMVGFLTLSVYFILDCARTKLIERENKQQWVKHLYLGGNG
jgi:heme exporter protein C